MTVGVIAIRTLITVKRVSQTYYDPNCYSTGSCPILTHYVNINKSKHQFIQKSSNIVNETLTSFSLLK